MDRDTKDILVVIFVALIVIVVLTTSMFIYSGMKSPLTVVESKSMQHSDDTSYVGVIDTGDMVIMVSPDKQNITTFVEGSKNGYQKFGSYGDVIIYYREGQNPVIHRAIIELKYNGDDTWSAPSLEGYEGKWSNNGNTDYMSMTGKFKMEGLGWRGLNAEIDLDSLAKHDGYLTNGDNNYRSDTDTYFDQGTIISFAYGPIQESDIKAIAGVEIPWLGCIKLIMNHKNEYMIPGNSVSCLIVMFIDIVMFFVMLSTILSYIYYRKDKKGY